VQGDVVEHAAPSDCKGAHFDVWLVLSNTQRCPDGHVPASPHPADEPASEQAPHVGSENPPPSGIGFEVRSHREVAHWPLCSHGVPLASMPGTLLHAPDCAKSP
jgi:hypothetical protein